MKEQPDCVIVLSFGEASPESAINYNHELAMIAEKYRLPIIAQVEVAAYCKTPYHTISKVNGYLDTWDVLTQAKAIMVQSDFKNALLIAHKAHINRVQSQAVKAGMPYTICPELPSAWDKKSKQWWTRSPRLWQVHECITVPYLKVTGKL